MWLTARCFDVQHFSEHYLMGVGRREGGIEGEDNGFKGGERGGAEGEDKEVKGMGDDGEGG